MGLVVGFFVFFKLVPGWKPMTIVQRKMPEGKHRKYRLCVKCMDPILPPVKVGLPINWGENVEISGTVWSHVGHIYGFVYNYGQAKYTFKKNTPKPKPQYNLNQEHR